MKTIYLVKAVYAEYVNNELKSKHSEKALFAESTREEAEKDIERFTKRNEQEKKEWFAMYTFGIFPSKYVIEEIKLY